MLCVFCFGVPDVSHRSSSSRDRGSCSSAAAPDFCVLCCGVLYDPLGPVLLRPTPAQGQAYSGLRPVQLGSCRPDSVLLSAIIIFVIVTVIVIF